MSSAPRWCLRTPRHPLVMAQQAATTNAASGGRFTLGIGLSHKPIIEGMFGMSYEHPARHMKEYLEVLAPALRNEKVDYQGKLYGAHGQIQCRSRSPCPLVVAALGERMLELAGTHADGTITWMTGPKTLEEHIIPKIRAAATRAGRPEPRIVAGVPTAIVTDLMLPGRASTRGMAMYGKLASHRGMLDREGAGGLPASPWWGMKRICGSRFSACGISA
ncbi:MAG: LLM class flavin-dependent oxidoreductase [Gammaproteobacteria bacterium]|nr:LLM class flavin-dependent oxidoreductase [Gammaproteobacteria bacterium]